MATTIHIPDEILRRIDLAVRSQRISRNRFIVDACRDALERFGGEWPDGFFDGVPSPKDARLLEEATMELDSVVRSHRMNRGAVAL